MVEIKVNDEVLDLPGGFAMQIEETNPVCNEVGSQSVSATVPPTPRNCHQLGHPERVDVNRLPSDRLRLCTVRDGAYLRSGKINVTEASPKEGITFNVGFDNSTLYSTWRNLKMCDLAQARGYDPPAREGGTKVDWLLEDLYKIYTQSNPKTDEFAVFPVAINKENRGKSDNGVEYIYWEILNVPKDGSLKQPAQVERYIDGKATDVKVPAGYMVSPFLRVWRAIELIFENLGVDIVSNPFKEYAELARLVILNNTADAACVGRILYRDIMPDCTVAEFLNALWVRFGLVYNVNMETSEARLVLMRDLLREPSALELLDYSAGVEKLTYETPKYVKLTAGTSLEGAEPLSERFEDFTRGIDPENIALGEYVGAWIHYPDKSRWDGDVYDEYAQMYDPDPDYPDMDYPDYGDDGYDDNWDDYWDERDDGDIYDEPIPDPPDADSRSVNSLSTAESRAASRAEWDAHHHPPIAYEFVTGKWYRLDETNGTVREAGSSFFNWDPQTANHEALELSSDDECVPVERVFQITNPSGTSFGHPYSDYTPCYLTGARHYHSVINGSDNKEKDGSDTPLAFVFAYTTGQKTIGRIGPEMNQGMNIELDDGSKPFLALTFQFRNGLFATFWKEYDEILRHSNTIVELPVRLNKTKLHNLEVIAPLTFKGVRCMFDQYSYTLPAPYDVPLEVKLRTLMPKGIYDKEAERPIAPFGVGARHAVWVAVADNYDVLHENFGVKKTAVNEFWANESYEEHGEPGNKYTVDWRSLVWVNTERLGKTFDTDTTKEPPTKAGQFKSFEYDALVTYEVYEILDHATAGGLNDYSTEDYLGDITVQVKYLVRAAARWELDDSPFAE